MGPMSPMSLWFIYPYDTMPIPCFFCVFSARNTKKASPRDRAMWWIWPVPELHFCSFREEAQQVKVGFSFEKLRWLQLVPPFHAYRHRLGISHYTLLHWICIAAAAVPPWFFLKFFPPRSPELFRNFWGVLPQNHLTCLGALLLSESGFCRASLLFLSSSDLPTQGLTCLGALLLSESAANSLFFCRYPLDFFSIAS